jgi:hypothetical protein
LRALIYRVLWTPAELRGLLNNRAALSAARHGSGSVEAISDLLPRVNRTRGDALEYILGRTLLRPRDAIAFIKECLASANKRERLTWPIIHKAEREYSQNRLLALRDEWKSTFSGIDRVLNVFSHAPPVLIGRNWSNGLTIVPSWLRSGTFRVLAG